MPFTNTRRFTRADFAEIRRLKYDEGWTQQRIASRYLVSRALIGYVLNLSYDEYYPAQPNRRPGAKLTEQDVMHMRELRRQGLTYPQLAAQFGIDKSAARLAVVGINWAEVPGAVDPAKGNIGERHHNARLTDHDVDLIRLLHRGGLGYGRIARKFEVGESTVRDIITGRTRIYSGVEA